MSSCNNCGTPLDEDNQVVDGMFICQTCYDASLREGDDRDWIYNPEGEE